MPANDVLVLIAYAQKLPINAFSVVSSEGRGLNLGPSADMRGSKKFCQRGPNSDNDFFDEMREGPNSTKSGSPLARQRNGIEMAFRWRADDCPTLNAS